MAEPDFNNMTPKQREDYIRQALKDANIPKAFGDDFVIVLRGLSVARLAVVLTELGASSVYTIMTAGVSGAAATPAAAAATTPALVTPAAAAATNPAAVATIAAAAAPLATLGGVIVLTASQWIGLAKALEAGYRMTGHYAYLHGICAWAFGDDPPGYPQDLLKAQSHPTAALAGRPRPKKHGEYWTKFRDQAFIDMGKLHKHPRLQFKSEDTVKVLMCAGAKNTRWRLYIQLVGAMKDLFRPLEYDMLVAGIKSRNMLYGW